MCPFYAFQSVLVEKKIELNIRNCEYKDRLKSAKVNRNTRNYDINDSASAPTDRSTLYSVLWNSLSGTAGGEDRPTHFYARATAIHHTAERTSEARIRSSSKFMDG